MNARKLSELDVEIDEDAVWFDCPACERKHSIAVGIKPGTTLNNGQVWQVVDARPEHLTLSPSVDCTKSDSCKFHGWVQDGMVRW